MLLKAQRSSITHPAVNWAGPPANIFSPSMPSRVGWGQSWALFDLILNDRSANICGQSFYFKICAKKKMAKSRHTRSIRVRQAQVSGIWSVSRKISEMWRSGSKRNRIVASRTERELSSGRHPAVFACTLHAALCPHSIIRNERSDAALLRLASLW